MAKSASQTTKKKSGSNFERVEILSRQDLRAWLKVNHKKTQSVWGVTWKKRPGAPHVPYAEIVEELLCFGWIDSLPRTIDENRSMLLLSPRKAGSNWSRLNKERAERLIKSGLMTAAGMEKIREAKTKGSWSFLDDVDALSEPPDLCTALNRLDGARLNWNTFPPSTRRGILEWIKNAKTLDTRNRRIRETAIMAAKGVRANQYRQKLPGVPKRQPTK